MLNNIIKMHFNSKTLKTLHFPPKIKGMPAISFLFSQKQPSSQPFGLDMESSCIHICDQPTSRCTRSLLTHIYEADNNR